MYESILIPTDGSSDAEKGAEHGVELAAALGATVHALYVIEEGTNPWEDASIEDQLDRAREYGESITGEVADLAAAAGVECVPATAIGPRVHRVINDYVEEEGIDAIVMGSGYRGSLGDILGSTADKVIRTSRVPVTILKRSETS